jgi:hypothetical protein
MEVIEVISHYVDKTQNIINIEFRLLGDTEDDVREDMIEYSFFEEFGFDNTKDFDIFESIIDEEDEWDNDEYDYINNEDDLLTFLNEFYVVYPDKLPKTQIK